MTRPGSREIDPGVLTDHATPERVDRVWARIERDLPGRAPVSGRSWSPWAALVGASLFASGVFVGAQVRTDPEPVARLAPEPERAPVVTTVPGAAQEPETRVETPGPEEHKPRRPRRLRAPVQTTVEPVPTPSAAIEEQAAPAANVAASPPAWQGYADEGYYAEALIAVEGQGGFDAVVSQATAEQLMLLVDVARATGRHERAVMALRRVVNQHGSDPNAPLAAWMLGNELSRAGNPDGAAQAFAMYRALSPQGDFAQDALTRQFEVAVEQNDVEQAERLAEQYARDFPEGPRLDEIRAQLEELYRIVDIEVAERAAGGASGAGLGLGPVATPAAAGGGKAPGAGDDEAPTASDVDGDPE